MALYLWLAEFRASLKVWPLCWGLSSKGLRCSLMPLLTVLLRQHLKVDEVKIWEQTWGNGLLNHEVWKQCSVINTSPHSWDSWEVIVILRFILTVAKSCHDRRYDTVRHCVPIKESYRGLIEGKSLKVRQEMCINHIMVAFLIIWQFNCKNNHWIILSFPELNTEILSVPSSGDKNLFSGF